MTRTRTGAGARKRAGARTRKATAHEKEAVEAIRAWELAEPGVVRVAIGAVTEPLAWAIRVVVPDAAMRGVLDLGASVADGLTDTQDVLRQAGVESPTALRSVDLRTCDSLANGVHDWGIGIAAVEGAATGAVGFLGAHVDIPLLLTGALRVIHKIGVCYGFPVETDADRALVLHVLASASANTAAERHTQVEALRSIARLLARLARGTLRQRAAERVLEREGFLLVSRALVKQLVRNIARRRALSALPAVGAALGAGANASYLQEVGWAARRTYQGLWLRTNRVRGLR